MNTRKTGADGEQKAVDFLIANNYEIIERNVHFGKVGEIDIVAKEKSDRTVVFIEVKFNRSKSPFGKPEFRCDQRKMKQIVKLVNLYIYNRKIYGKPVRIDMIAIDNDGIRHYKNCMII